MTRLEAGLILAGIVAAGAGIVGATEHTPAQANGKKICEPGLTSATEIADLKKNEIYVAGGPIGGTLGVFLELRLTIISAGNGQYSSDPAITSNMIENTSTDGIIREVVIFESGAYFSTGIVKHRMTLGKGPNGTTRVTDTIDCPN